ncbi:MAG: amidohydrolase family protein [Candidatus Latescibacterota bacterium]
MASSSTTTFLKSGYPPMVQEVHAHGLKASIHCLQTGLLAAAQAGVDEFFHLDGILTDVWPDHPPGWLDVWGLPGFDETLDAQEKEADQIARFGMTATPTLAYWRSRWRIHVADCFREEARYVPPEIVAWQGGGEKNQQAGDQWCRALEAAKRLTGLLLKRNVPILPGTDVPFAAVCPGRSLWQELSLLVGSGMCPLRALQTATLDAADFLDRPMLGRLAPGAVADFAIVRGDPTARIPEDPHLVATVHNGVIHHPEKLLAQAQKAAGTVTKDPWSAQFRIHSAVCGDPAGSG